MYSFEFSHINPLQDFKSLQQGFFLCIWHANKIPPHIGVVIDGCPAGLNIDMDFLQSELDRRKCEF